jgi:hypothetical protein
LLRGLGLRLRLAGGLTRLLSLGSREGHSCYEEACHCEAKG